MIFGDVAQSELYKVYDDNYTSLRKKTYLSFGNHTGIDIHIQVIGVEQNNGTWGPKQLNNGQGATVNSKKVDFGNKATYKVSLWKNDAGSPGTHIGDFEHSVRNNLAGNTDYLEFLIVTIGDTTYFQAISAKEGVAFLIAILL